MIESGAPSLANLCDILMITHNRPQYTRKSLQRLLDTADEQTRIWLWHNGDHEETLDIVKEFLNHPRVWAFCHSRENVSLNGPTNWLWQNAKGNFLGKVDDDCLVPFGWIERLRMAHADEPKFGILGCWFYLQEDIIPQRLLEKLREAQGGHQIMLNCWVGGSGYLMKRECVRQGGLLKSGETFPHYSTLVANRGWMNGWYYPFLYQDHMDDPRSPNTMFTTDDAFREHIPLSAKAFGIQNLEQWTEKLKSEAVYLQTADPNPRVHLRKEHPLYRAIQRAYARIYRITGRHAR